MFQLNHDRLKIKDKLGQGIFGAVFPYQKHPRDIKWVVKKVYAKNSDALVASLPEVILGMSCDHPNVVPIKSYFIEKNSEKEGGGFNIYTKLPRMKRTLMADFKERKEKNHSYSEEEIIHQFHSLVCGLEYLHKKKIYHEGIKLETLLLDDKGVLKIGDIGMSKLGQINFPNQKEKEKTINGDEHKRKKEMLINADIWSLGIVILELCCFDLRKVNQGMATANFQNLLKEIFESVKRKYHPEVIGLLQSILCADPKKRPSLGLIKSELEKNFLVTLMKDEGKRQKLSEKVPDEQIQEMFGKFEADINHLKGVISQFETELTKKSEKKNHAKITTKDGEVIEEETKVNDSQDELKRLREERKIFAEKEKNLNKHIDKAAKEKIQVFLAEKVKYQEEIASLQAKLKKSEVPVAPKKESSEKDDEISLEKVVSQLKSKWNKWYATTLFKFKSDGKNLKITGQESPELTDKTVTGFFSVLSKEPFRLQHLDIYFNRCGGITEGSIGDLSSAIIAQSPYLKHLQLFFSASTELNDKSLKILETAISKPALRLLHLEITFNDVPGITDRGFESLAEAIELYHKNVQFLKLSFVNCGVTLEKKGDVFKRFYRIPRAFVV